MHIAHLCVHVIKYLCLYMYEHLYLYIHVGDSHVAMPAQGI